MLRHLHSLRSLIRPGALLKSLIISISEVVASTFLLVALAIVVVAKSFVTCRVQQRLGGLWY
jgi:hypothetical protein